MTDIELVIKIPEEEYKRLVYIDIFKLRGYIENGTPLPKRHGNLVDVKEVVKLANESKDIYGALWKAPIIIEAEGEVSDEDSN